MHPHTTYHRRSFTPEEISYIQAFYPTLGCSHVAKHLNRHNGSIEKAAKRLGLRFLRLPPLNEEEQMFLKEHYPLYGEKYCAQHLKRSIHIVRQTVKSLGLHKRVAAAKRETSIDLAPILNIEKPEIAYLLGFIWADGHVNPRQASLFIKLEDWLTIKPVAECIPGLKFSTRPARTRAAASGGFYTGHKGLISFLLEHDYALKSVCSPTKILSRIPDHLKHYWWRGYTDGDGHFHVGKAGRYAIVMAGSFTQDWKDSESLLTSLGITYQVVRRERLNHQSQKMNRDSIVKINNRQGFVSFGSYLYQGWETGAIGLSRKHTSYLAGCEQIERHKQNLLKRSQPVSVFSKTWEPLGEYPSIQAAGKALNVKPKLIREYFQFNRAYCKGYQFKRLPKPA
jgi:hypothetical protein